MRWQTLLLAITGVLWLAGIAVAEPPPRFPAELLSQLLRSKEIYVATQRKDGRRSAAAPVWFGVVDDTIWFATRTGSHKANRIRRGSPVYVSVKGKDGPFVETRAEISTDGGMADRLGEIYAQKYWRAWVGMFRPGHKKIAAGTDVLVHLTPAR
ncbi:MAG: Pyridoxamine 5'-phosphate oxidase like [Deltaproteobacteria bacterium]|nr:Pyridoxamine 5'-phosphate oxidase like [Deltaproteobacteria bacterium]